MAGPIAIDTPDYQRGVVSAQLLLGGGGPIDHSATVGVPPNAETLVVVVPGNTLTATRMGCAGTHTGATYPVIPAYAPSHDYATTFFIDVTQTVDTEVEISGVEPGEQAWFVYADSGVHIVTDASGATTGVGQRYVVPSVPSVYAGDHPPNELTYHSAVFSAAGVMLPALLAGQRYRVFAAQLMLEAGTLVGYLGDSLSGEIFLIGGAGSPGQLSYPLTGLPLPATASINFFVATGAGTVAGMVVYTIENV